jgi:hypothetical protein
MMRSSKRTASLEIGAPETRKIRILSSESQSMPKYHVPCGHYQMAPINRSPVELGSLHWRGILSRVRLCTRVSALAVLVLVHYISWPVLGS